jgi:hypothetical protein
VGGRGRGEGAVREGGEGVTREGGGREGGGREEGRGWLRGQVFRD